MADRKQAEESFERASMLVQREEPVVREPVQDTVQKTVPQEPQARTCKELTFYMIRVWRAITGTG